MRGSLRQINPPRAAAGRSRYTPGGMNPNVPSATARVPRRALLGLALLSCGLARAADTAPVSLEAARAALESGQALVFDVREPAEHATGVARGARLLPMSQLQQRAREIPADGAPPVLVICNTQNRSRKVVEALRQAGWSDVRYVEGGMSEWVKRGWPVVSPPR